MPSEYFGVRLRHTNRKVTPGVEDNRHLVVSEIRVTGAQRATMGPAEYAFFGETQDGPAPGRGQTIKTKHLELTLWSDEARWSLTHVPSGSALIGGRPVLHIRGLDVDLTTYEREVNRAKEQHELGEVTHLTLEYSKPGELDVTYEILLSADGDEAIARLGFTNNTGGELQVGRLAPVVATEVKLGRSVYDWAIIGDAKANSHPYNTVRGRELEEFESWWYAAAKNLETGRSVVLGSLSNSKGLGRFLVLPGDDVSARAAAYLDYEGATMPAGASIEGEWMLVHFGKRGTDGLERLGELIAKDHGIDLMADHPIDPYDLTLVDVFNTWNSYGSAVMKGFDYGHDRAKHENAYEDPDWRKACVAKVYELGLERFGYARNGPVNREGLPTPLARRYGQPDFWFKAAEQISKDHPEFYIDGRVDFSNPEVIAFERERVRQAYEGKTAVMTYGLDFTNRWEKLDGQYDPFMTSAETYRADMGLWREAGNAHPEPVYCLMWMNVVGINYDMLDVIHIGHDSDQGYGGEGLTFTHGLTRQISGRYFLNGRVWWNSPDSYHVYCGGIYSYEQAKTHASYCSLSGNLVHLAEPLADEEMPEDRLDIIRRVAPTTPDTARAVDVFENNPARLWDMHVEREFGDWHVVGLFNVDYDGEGTSITEEIRFADLGLDADEEYLVYEFWSKQFLGAHAESFTRTLSAPDCEVYAIVEALDRPVLMSTSRHVRQMAYDIRGLSWDDGVLSGASRMTQDDPYELRIHVPEGWTLDEASAGELEVATEMDGPVLMVRFTSPVSEDTEWEVRFAER